VREIRSIRPDIPVIISTGFDTKFVEGDLERLGVNRLLLKPFGYEELAQAIREVIDAHYLRDGQIESDEETEHAMESMAPIGLAGAAQGNSEENTWGEKLPEDNDARISVIETEEGIIIEISGQQSLSEEEKQKLLSLYAQAKKNGKHTVVQCENRLYEFLKVTGFDKFLELSVLQ
jgi:DNA-binding NarL/FixJ family response regulator